MGYNRSFRSTDEAWQQMGNDWFEQALRVAEAGGIAHDSTEFRARRSYTAPGAKLNMQKCSKYYLLEGVRFQASCHHGYVHRLHSSFVRARFYKQFLC